MKINELFEKSSPSIVIPDFFDFDVLGGGDVKGQTSIVKIRTP
jgi:hypothetical protein